MFTDASFVQADASKTSVVNQHSLKRYLNKNYRELESRLEQQHDHEPKKGEANRKHISTTDPDASVVRMGPGRSKLKYKIHRAIDEKHEVITATDVSAGEKNEAHLLIPLVDQHQANTGKTVKTKTERAFIFDQLVRHLAKVQPTMVILPIVGIKISIFNE